MGTESKCQLSSVAVEVLVVLHITVLFQGPY
jgi:hypothetical protein